MQDFQIPLKNCGRCTFWDRYCIGQNKEGIVVGLCEQERDQYGSLRYKQTKGSDSCQNWRKVDALS